MKFNLERFVFNTYLLLFALRLTVFIDNPGFNQIFGGISVLFLLMLIYLKRLTMRLAGWILLAITSMLISISLLTVIRYSYDIDLFVYDVLRYLALIALFTIGSYAAVYVRPKKLLQVFFIIIIFHIAFALIDVVSADILQIGGQLRLAGFFDHTAKFGLFFGFACIALFLLLRKSQNNRLFLFALLLALLGFLAYNNTLRIIFALIASAGFFFIVIKRKFIYLLVILTASFFLVLLNSEVKERFSSILNSEINPNRIVYGEKLDNSFQWRLLQWSMLIKDWNDKHVLTGAGIGQETNLDGIKKPGGVPFIAHSDFVKILIETGVIGFTLFGIILINFYNVNVRVCKKYDLDDGIIVFLFFLLCSMLGSALFTETFFAYTFALGYLSNFQPDDDTLVVK